MLDIHFKMAKTPVNKIKTTDYTGISERFRSVRTSLGLTQKEFGEQVGLSAPAVGAIENGLYTPNFSVIRILKQKFNIDYDYLIDGTINENLPKDYKQISEEVVRLRKVIDKITG